MILLRLYCNSSLRFLAGLVIVSCLIASPSFCQETEDSQVFIAGFNAYQQKDYATSIEKLNEVLQKHPDTPLRDMALFWLSRSYYKTGNQWEAARYLSKFSKEYPDNPLKNTVDEELLSLTVRYEKGEKLPGGPPAAVPPEILVAQNTAAEKDRVTAKPEEPTQANGALDPARVAAPKPPEENAVAEKSVQERVAMESAAREKAVQQVAAAIRSDNTRLNSEPSGQQQVAVANTKQDWASQESVARENAVQQVIADIKAEKARLNAEQEKKAIAKAGEAKAEQERLAAIDAEKATEKTEQERTAQESAAREKAIQQVIEDIKAEKLRKADKVEQERLAAVKAEQAWAEQEHLAKAKAEEERIAQERIAKAKAEEERIAQERLAAVKAQEMLRAEAAAETARLAAQRAEAERLARVQAAEREQIALAKAQEVKKTEAARLASLKAEEERNAADRSAKEKESRRLAALKAEETRMAELKLAAEKDKMAKVAYREKAIGQYKAIIDKFPTSSAAATAAAKLRELGVAVSLPRQMAEATPQENAQVLRLEVEQFAGFEFNLLSHPAAFAVGRPVSVPFEIINRGNGNDSFSLGSSFPADFKAQFAAATTPGAPIKRTPNLSPGDTFKGVLNFVIPPGNIDGLRVTYPIKAVSNLAAEASQSREVRLVASAPLLRAVLRAEKTRVLPGDKVTYKIAVLNVGSAIAQDVALRLNFPPQLEPIGYAAAGFGLDANSALKLDGLQINSGESREFNIVFKLKDGTLAGQELSTRAELINIPLKTSSSFVSNVVVVEPQRSLFVRSGADRIDAIPGQTISVPFVVTNTGNIREKFKITSVVTGGQTAVIYNDLNRDGIRQANEPVITEIGPLAPREEANVVVEVKTPATATDGSKGSVQISFVSEGDATRSASGTTQLNYSRPILKMVMSALNGRLKPGNIASFDLTITNNGSNLARMVDLRSTWPDQLELVAADPAAAVTGNGSATWRLKEMGAGEKRIFQVSFRLKPGTGVGTGIQVKNILTYEDQLGNRY